MRIRLLPEAEREVLDATSYLADQSEGAAERFLEELADAKDRVLQFPNGGSRIGKGARRLLFRRHSYQLIYCVTADEIVVIAVAHLSRRPNYWRKRET
ncbi:MAG: type II toxin-antitoxin system RelE/ParE family toxin [Hyphomicrobiaceae bacterium]